jgi:hypothetical protein
MTAAIFALVGTLLGISGTLLVEIRRGRAEATQSRREALRNTCADFTDAIIRVRELAIRWQQAPSDSSLRESTWKAHDETWTQYERLRLISASTDVQEAGRHLIRYTWGLMREAEGKTLREDEQADGPFALTYEWLQKFTLRQGVSWVCLRPRRSMPSLESGESRSGRPSLPSIGQIGLSDLLLAHGT